MRWPPSRGDQTRPRTLQETPLTLGFVVPHAPRVFSCFQNKLAHRPPLFRHSRRSLITVCFFCSFFNRLNAIVLIVRSFKAPWVHRCGRPAGTPRRAVPVVPHRCARRRRRSYSLPSPPPARDRRGSGRLPGARYFPLALGRSSYLRKPVKSFRNDFGVFFSILLFISPCERSRCSDPVAVMLEC